MGGAAFCGGCGAPAVGGPVVSQPGGLLPSPPSSSGAGVGVPPVAVAMAGSGDRRRWWWVVLAAVVAAVTVGAVVGVVLRSSGESVEVVLESVGSESESPFTESVVSEGVVPADLVGFSTASSGASGAAGSSSGVVVSQVSGDRAGLYGSTGAGPVCSAEGLALRLAAEPAVAEVWAGVAGVEVGEVDGFVKSLTPVVLGRDTAVTNHVYEAGGARAFQSVLEAGMPVLVDATGAPRVQCSCGNPLLAPAVAGAEVELVGERWEGFDPSRVSEVTPAAAPVAEIETVDVGSGEPVTVALGGGAETVELDGLLVADDAGVHVYSEAGEKLATVLDQPVERVFDDGAGGLIYNLARPPDPDGGPTFPETKVPDSGEQATVWHLPAGETEPVPLIENRDPATRWAVVEATGTLGGRRVLIYADMTLTQYPGLNPSEYPEGPLVLRDLESGEDQVIEEDAYGWELNSNPVSVADDRIAYENGFAYATWVVRGPGLSDISTPCGDPDPIAGSECLYGGALLDATHIVGTATSETGDSLSLEVDDLATGEGRVLNVSPGGYVGEWTGQVHVDAYEGRALVSYIPDDGEEAFPTVLVDVAADSSTEVNATGLVVRFLRAPLVRPAEGVAAPPSEPEEAPPPPAPEEPPASSAPPGPPGDCGATASVTGEVKVIVVVGSISCDDALSIVDRYFHSPDTPHEGSSAFATVGEWECFVDTIRSETGAVGACEREAGGVIEIHPAPPEPVTAKAAAVLAAAEAGDIGALVAEIDDLAGFSYSFSDPDGDPTGYFEANPEAITAIVSILQDPPALDSDRCCGPDDFWFYPESWVTAEEGSDAGYGPRLGIRANGSWEFFVIGGD